jgi:CRP/FNR family transcriptional regulator, cyclic AMP receptor protein
MITREDLKQIVMLTYLTDPMLDNLAQVVDVLKFDKDEIIFRENEPSERFYMLRSGQVLLEQSISDQVTACVAAIKPGYSFGWSAMLENETYTVSAVCEEASEVYSFKWQKIRKLFEQDPEMGLRMHQRLLVIIKKRLDIRTEQFKKAIMNHPDMQSLFT